jgi:hypothetical protein
MAPHGLTANAGQPEIDAARLLLARALLRLAIT